MSDIPLIGANIPNSDAPPTEVHFSPSEANYVIHLVDFWREGLEELMSKVPPAELLVLLAFLQAAFETQIPAARGAFDEVREFFGQVYPVLLRSVPQEEREKMGEGFLMIWPKPNPNAPATDSISDNPRIIVPGNGSIN